MTDPLKDLFLEFGLSYHYHHLMLAMENSGPLEGKKCIEFGGCLPREIVVDNLGAAQWVGIDSNAYWEESGDDNPSRTSAADKIQLDGFCNLGAGHCCLEGDIQDIPASLDGQFDLVFSTSAFEHIANPTRALQVASRLLKKGGTLFVSAMPIWPSTRGHHLPPIEYQGTVFSFSNPPIPDWAHLFMSPQEMTDSLALWLPAETVREIVYMCYASPQINRFFAEDFEEAFALAPFETRSIEWVPEKYPPLEIEAKIFERHGRQRLGVIGVYLRAVR